MNSPRSERKQSAAVTLSNLPCFQVPSERDFPSSSEGKAQRQSYLPHLTETCLCLGFKLWQTFRLHPQQQQQPLVSDIEWTEWAEMIDRHWRIISLRHILRRWLLIWLAVALSQDSQGDITAVEFSFPTQMAAGCRAGKSSKMDQRDRPWSNFGIWYFTCRRRAGRLICHWMRKNDARLRSLELNSHFSVSCSYNIL